MGHENLCLNIELDVLNHQVLEHNKARHMLAFCTPFSVLQFLTFDKPET